jgi:hypothetical protein
MTNTQIMELLHNQASNQQRRKELFIAIGIIAVGGIAFYYYQKHMREEYGALERKYVNCQNSTDIRFNEISQILAQKDNIIMKNETVIRNQENKIASLIKENINDMDSL